MIECNFEAIIRFYFDNRDFFAKKLVNSDFFSFSIYLKPRQDLTILSNMLKATFHCDLRTLNEYEMDNELVKADLGQLVRHQFRERGFLFESSGHVSHGDNELIIAPENGKCVSLSVPGRPVKGLIGCNAEL
jgi:hypothetical protein